MSAEPNLDEESVFSEVIENDQTICSNCYRRIKVVLDSEEWASAYLSETKGDMLADKTYFEEHTERANPPSRKSAHYITHSCSCGSVQGQAKVRPLDKGTTMDYARNVVSRLEEAEIEFDSEAFLDEVRWRKQEPEYQFNEEKIFEESLEESINE